MGVLILELARRVCSEPVSSKNGCWSGSICFQKDSRFTQDYYEMLSITLFMNDFAIKIIHDKKKRSELFLKTALFC